MKRSYNIKYFFMLITLPNVSIFFENTSKRSSFLFLLFILSLFASLLSGLSVHGSLQKKECSYGKDPVGQV